MQIVGKEQVDKVLGSYKALKARRRKDLIRAQEKAAALALKAKEAAAAAKP